MAPWLAMLGQSMALRQQQQGGGGGMQMPIGNTGGAPTMGYEAMAAAASQRDQKKQAEETDAMGMRRPKWLQAIEYAAAPHHMAGNELKKKLGLPR